MSDSTIHIGTLASNNVTAAQALVKARERNGRELQNGERAYYYYYKQMIYDVLAYKKENGTIPRYQIQMDVGGN